MLAFAAVAAMVASHSPNAVSVEPAVNVPRLQLGATYERAFVRRLTVAGGLEHTFSPRNYTHLPGIAERLSFGVWIFEAFSGPYAEATFGLAHNVFHKRPRHARHAALLGANLGYRFAIGPRWLVGLSGGVRWTLPLGETGAICTRDFQCPSTAPGVAARVAFHVGWRWGDA